MRFNPAIRAIGITAWLYYASLAAAQPVPDREQATDWLTVAGLLRSQGISVEKINWFYIDQLCLPLQTSQDQTRFNQCKYEKAWYQHRFTIDQDMCNNRAAVMYSHSYRRPLTHIITDKMGHAQWVETIVPPYRLSELEQLRRAAYAECMYALDWQSPDDWATGQRIRALPYSPR